MPTSCLVTMGCETGRPVDRAGDRPCHFGHVLRNTANHLPLEILHNLRAALDPPHLRPFVTCRRSQRQGIGQVGERIGLGLVVVGMLGAASLPLGLDEAPLSQWPHHVPMIFGGGPIRRGRHRQQIDSM